LIRLVTSQRKKKRVIVAAFLSAYQESNRDKVASNLYPYFSTGIGAISRARKV
jgi:hypothetical protein